MNHPTFSDELDRSGFQARSVRFAPRSRLEEHAHDSSSLCVTLMGDYTECRGSRGVHLSTGCAILCPAGEPHAQLFGRLGAVKVIVALGLRFQTLPKEAVNRVIRSPQIMRAGSLIASELRRPDRYSRLAVEGLALELQALFLRNAMQSPLSDAVRHVDQRLREEDGEFSIEEIAKHLGQDPLELAAAYKRHTGSSIGQRARAFRLEEAARKLTATAEPIAAIAAAGGFYDQPHFTRAFRRSFGMTPGRFRRMLM